MEEPKQPEQIMQDITQCIKKLDISNLDPRVQVEVRSGISTIISSAIRVLDGSDYRWCGANIIAEDKEIKMIYRSFARPLYKLIDRVIGACTFLLGCKIGCLILGGSFSFFGCSISFVTSYKIYYYNCN